MYFLKKLALFLLPLFLLFAPATLVLWQVGEFYPSAYLGKLARTGAPIVVGSAYSNTRGNYQLQETLIRQPEVVALGTSRVGGFRAVFFKDPIVFYNDTGTGGVLSNFRYFLEKLSDNPPRIIIAGMDAYFFNPEEVEKNSVVTRPDPFIVQSSWHQPLLGGVFLGGAWWKIYPDYFAGKFTLSKVFGERSGDVTYIGLRAVADGNGFLNDGSNYFGDVINSKEKQQKALEGIAALAASISVTNGDEYGSGISPEALDEVRRFLDTAKKQGSYVIGFIPPLSQAEYERLKAFPDAPYAYAFKNLGSVLSGIYREYGFDFYDFTDITSFGGSDIEMVESKHGSEKIYLRMFIKMAERNKQLGALVDTRYLTKKLHSAESNLVVFPL